MNTGTKKRTNVTPGQLNYDHYETKQYDDEIKHVIPGWENVHLLIEEIINQKVDKIGSVLELGIGTGLTAGKILQYLPDVRYTGIDFSEQMLYGAKEKLKDYDVDYLLADYAKIDLPQNNDLVVSVIGIHHQETDDDKKMLFQKIYNSLNKNGAFIFADLVTYRDPQTAAFNDALHYHHLVKYAKNEQSLKEWAYHHKFLNKLAALEDQIYWLKEVGFRSVDVRYQEFNTALIYAKK